MEGRMKLKNPMTADYDPASRLFKISGKNSIGKQSSVEFEVEDEDAFIGWLISEMHEKYQRPEGAGKALKAQAIEFGLHQNRAGAFEASFSFSAGDLRLAFLAPIQTTAPERIAAIKGHLEQALAEMGHSKSVSKQ